MGFSVRGHICIRRKAKDGNPGEAGKSIRTTVWETGKQYYAGDTQVDGVYPLDIVADKAISIGVSGVNFYMCRTSHTSAANIPLTNTAYWTKLNNLKPVVTYLILAELIKANYIDVEDLAANTAFIQTLIATSAFIDNLSVKHLNGADGIFSGGIKVPFASSQNLPYLSAGPFISSGYSSMNIYCRYLSTAYGSIIVDNNNLSSNFNDSFYQARYIYLPQGQAYDGMTFNIFVNKLSYTHYNRDGSSSILLAPTVFMIDNNSAKVGIVVPTEGGNYTEVPDEDYSYIEVLYGFVQFIAHWDGSRTRWILTAGQAIGMARWQ